MARILARASDRADGSGAGAAIAARGRYIADGTAYYIAAERTAYNTNGTVAGACDPKGNTATIAYDSNYALFPVSAADPAGHPTTLTLGELPFQVEIDRRRQRQQRLICLTRVDCRRTKQ